MLYLHCGWPRTGTTGLQMALFQHRDRLAADGITYPDRWRGRKAHHGLYELVGTNADSRRGLDRFRRFLDSQDGKDVLLSAEGISMWLRVDAKREAFLGLLAVARRSMPTRCVWTLRRFDEVLESMYLVQLRFGADLMPPSEYFELAQMQSGLFEGMRAVEEVSGNEVAYLQYDAGGMHHRDLLRAIGVSGRCASTVARDLALGPRRNASLSHKQAVVLANAELLSARVGVDLDPSRLRTAFSQGFEFDCDRPCELVDKESRMLAHQRALSSARRVGNRSYVEFFESAEIAAAASPGLGADAVSNADLDLLAAHLRDHAGSTKLVPQ